MFGEAELRIRIELADSSKMHIAADPLLATIEKRRERASTHLRIVTRTDLSAARSCKSSITSLRSSLWFLAVQWSSKSSKTSTPPSNLLKTLPKRPVLPRALMGSRRREVRL